MEWRWQIYCFIFTNENMNSDMHLHWNRFSLVPLNKIQCSRFPTRYKSLADWGFLDKLHQEDQETQWK